MMMITEDDIEDLAGPVNPALSARIQRNINDAIERNKGTVLNRKIKLLIVAAKKDGKVGAVKEKPAFGEPADQPSGDQGIDLGGMFAETSAKAKLFSETVENDTDADASEDQESQESAQEGVSTDNLPEYQTAFDILDDLTKSGIT